MLFGRLLDNLIRFGRLTVIDAGGRRHEFGPGDGPTAAIRLHDRSLHHKLFFRPELFTGEAYMDGTLTIEDGSLYGFLDLVGRNIQAGTGAAMPRVVQRLDWMFRRFQQLNPVHRSRRNVQHHYDLTGELYGLFLEPDRQYSCAYFVSPDDDLERAQAQKKRHIAGKLLIRPGMSVLDIGSGWGGLGLFLAEALGARVDGVTLSTEQLAEARRRAAEAGIAERVHFELRDYREQTGTYDRIVSVGMFEHVGVNHFDRFFATVRRLLAEDGVALLHTIGRADGPGTTNPWIRRYIFPGGYIPALSEVVPAIERSGLVVTDVEVLRLHYAETLRHWRERFAANRERAAALYDERFCRMWEYYLAGSEISFRYLGCVVFQIQLARRQEAVPLTRDYIAAAERALAGDGHAATDRAA